jgi:chromosomal replication initiation ATPase DnaA
MKVAVELLPAISKILTDCENQLYSLIGSPIKVKLIYTPTSVNEETFQNLICDQFNVHWHQIVSHTRKAEAVIARHVYWWLCYKWLNATSTSLGEKFNRDHSTVLYALGKVNDLIAAKDDFVCSKIRNIEEVISAKR